MTEPAHPARLAPPSHYPCLDDAGTFIRIPCSLRSLTPKRADVLLLQATALPGGRRRNAGDVARVPRHSLEAVEG